MAAPRRRPFEAEKQREQISALYLKGRTQYSIADELQISRAMVAYDLKVIQDRWHKSTTMNLDDAKARELAKIDKLEATYWEAWERSCEMREATMTEQRKTDDGSETKASLRHENRDGNPAFLAGVMQCIERRCRLLGIDAPVKAELTGKGGGPLVYEVLVPDQETADMRKQLADDNPRST